MNALVTGGAGYIGSILTEQLINNGISVVILDNLSRGHEEALNKKAKFLKVDLANISEIDNALKTNQIEIVFHLAAESQVEISVKDPSSYYQSNVVNGLNLLNAMLQNNIKKLIFSSTASVYGQPEKIPIQEDNPLSPQNPYGESKLIFEKILNSYRTAYGINYIALRYFNVAGASKEHGEDHDPETHIIPNVLKVALKQKDRFSIYGNDYETKDGSCIRDYIHVLDIAKAHILAMDKLEKNLPINIFNLGNGSGYSVFDIVQTSTMITGMHIPIEICPRRKGDPSCLIASAKMAEKYLGWYPEHDLEDIVRSAWLWHKNRPYGYN